MSLPSAASSVVSPKTSAESSPPSPPSPPHTVIDDVQAVASAVVMASLGLALFNSAGLMTGGTPGLGFLLSYATGMPLGMALFLANLPFYWLGWRGMGARFTLKTLAVVTVLSIAVEAVRHLLVVQTAPVYAALAGGVLMGTGLLMMFRHKASFGGITILALYLQKRLGWAPGKVQMVIDLILLSSALLVMDAGRVGWSVLGSLAVNAVLMWNHRPGRYSASA